MPFKLNWGYYPKMSYKDNVDPQSKFKLADKLPAEIRELMIVCQKNLYHAQEFQKQVHDKATKLKSYASSNEIWLNSKYIKTKCHWKLEAKFFRPFQVLHFIGKQALLQQFSISENSLICFTRIIPTNWPWVLLLLTPHHQWFDQQSNQQSSLLNFSSKSVDN